MPWYTIGHHDLEASSVAIPTSCLLYENAPLHKHVKPKWMYLDSTTQCSLDSIFIPLSHVMKIKDSNLPWHCAYERLPLLHPSSFLVSSTSKGYNVITRPYLQLFTNLDITLLVPKVPLPAPRKKTTLWHYINGKKELTRPLHRNVPNYGPTSCPKSPKSHEPT